MEATSSESTVQVGAKAYESEDALFSDWTEELARILKSPVDIKLMLMNI